MSELMAITTYYNPCGYVTRRRNYDVFMVGMRQAGVPCITVEAAFGNAPFELPPALDVLQVRAESLLWQKERLLNLAASWLPRECRYVAWLDCDIVFHNPAWPHELVDVLRRHQVAQVWETCHRLGPDRTETGDRARSFAATMGQDRSLLDCGRYDRHGHTGYGWAMRREIFDQVGLYEAAVSGSADHFMAHAIYDQYGFCVENALKRDANQIRHLMQWGERFYAMARGSLGVVSGEIDHLWHGESSDRRYFLRMHEITDLGFNPWTDLVAEPGKPLAWHRDVVRHKPTLVAYFSQYFQSRREDGMMQEAA